MGLRFGVLGPLQVCSDNDVLPLGSTKQRILLTTLLLQPNQTVSLDRLTAALWEDSPPRSAVSNLRTYANRLRQALSGYDAGPARIVARHPGYTLVVEPGELDSVDFNDRLLLGQAELAKGSPRDAIGHLSAGLALWRGKPAEDIPRTLPLGLWLDRLDEQRCLALESMAAARLAIGDHDRLIPELRNLVAMHPTRERLWSHLMLALYRSGDTAAALVAFRAAREIFAESLGVDPGPDLVALQQAILKRDPKLSVLAAEPRCRGASRRPGHGRQRTRRCSLRRHSSS